MENFQMSITMATSLAAAYTLLMLVFLRMPDRMADHRVAIAPKLQSTFRLLTWGVSGCLFMAIFEAIEAYRGIDNPFEEYTQLVFLVAWGYLLVFFAVRVFEIIIKALKDSPRRPASLAIRARLRDRKERRK